MHGQQIDLVTGIAMRVPYLVPILLLLSSPACSYLVHSPEEEARYRKNAAELASSKKEPLILCSEHYTWQTGPLTGASVFMSAPYDKNGGALTFSGNWGSIPLSHPERQSGIIPGVTKFLSVTAQGVWNTDSMSPSDDFVRGGGGISLSVGTFPYHHPPAAVLISSSDGNGRPLNILSFNADPKIKHSIIRRSQSDLIDFTWKTIVEQRLNKFGAIINVKVNGEDVNRIFPIPGAVFTDSIKVFTDLRAKIKDYNADYMYKCDVSHPEPIFD